MPAAAAESGETDIEAANASNGGVASTTVEGTIEIGEIVTGENTGNTIVAGDITGSAEFHGGVIDSPTEVTVTQVIEPSIATANGGDEGEATASEKETTGTQGAEDELTIINTNINRSSATIE